MGRNDSRSFNVKQERKLSRTFLSAKSETRKGFTLPSLKRIKTALRQKSKTFLVELIATMFAKLTKTDKIKILIKIDKGISKKVKKFKTKRRKSKARKRKAKARKRKSKAKKKSKGKVRFKVITIKKRGGGTRKQRVKVFASGKFQFVKNK